MSLLPLTNSYIITLSYSVPFTSREGSQSSAGVRHSTLPEVLLSKESYAIQFPSFKQKGWASTQTQPVHSWVKNWLYLASSSHRTLQLVGQWCHPGSLVCLRTKPVGICHLAAFKWWISSLKKTVYPLQLHVYLSGIPKTHNVKDLCIFKAAL